MAGQVGGKGKEGRGGGVHDISILGVVEVEQQVLLCSDIVNSHCVPCHTVTPLPMSLREQVAAWGMGYCHIRR